MYLFSDCMFARRLLRPTFVLTRDMTIKAGDKLPSATVTLSNPGDKQDIKDFCKGKKTLLVGVVGAFTPTCDNQIPPFVAAVDDLKAKGVNQVAVITVNDAFVCTKWGESMTVGDKVTMLSDYKAEFAKAAGLELPGVEEKLGNLRSTRFMMLINDDTVEKISVEENPGEVQVTGIDTAKTWL